VTGYVARWTPGKGESEVRGTRVAYPNGVVCDKQNHGWRRVTSCQKSGGKCTKVHCFLTSVAQ